MKFSAIRKHLNPATALAFVALVFAITGGAFAATGNGGGAGAKASAAVTRTATTAKAKAKPKAKAGPRGPAGPKGATGAAGPAGPAGSAGPQGPAGGPGPAGNNGANGSNGESVASATLKKGEGGCTEGGSKFTVSGKETSACNGAKGAAGPEGPEGALGTAGTTLPAGASETGVWAWAGPSEEHVNTPIHVPISFTVPLAGYLLPKDIHIFGQNETAPAGCTLVKTEEENEEDPPEKVEATELKAQPGNLCIDIQHSAEVGESKHMATTNLEDGEGGAGKTGTDLSTATNGSVGNAEIAGQWAVTAPEA